MANNISTNCSMNVTVDGVAFGANKSAYILLTGSNALGASINVSTSSWQAIDISTLADVRSAWFYNYSTGTGKITVATGSAGGNVLQVLKPGDVACTSWSGSMNSLYVKAVTSQSVEVASLQYIISES